MVKRQAYTNVDRYMTEYRMRTPYATPTPLNRLIPDQYSARSTRQHAAHERSHLRHQPIEASYHYEGRVEKSPRKKTSPPQQDYYQQENSYNGKVATTSKKSSCCTIL